MSAETKTYLSLGFPNALPTVTHREWALTATAESARRSNSILRALELRRVIAPAQTGFWEHYFPTASIAMNPTLDGLQTNKQTNRNLSPQGISRVGSFPRL